MNFNGTGLPLAGTISPSTRVRTKLPLVYRPKLLFGRRASGRHSNSTPVKWSPVIVVRISYVSCVAFGPLGSQEPSSNRSNLAPPLEVTVASSTPCQITLSPLNSSRNFGAHTFINFGNSAAACFAAASACLISVSNLATDARCSAVSTFTNGLVLLLWPAKRPVSGTLLKKEKNW